MKELVSVYIPTHNRVELLKRALNSVLEQDYPNIEILIVNDASTDNTYEFLESIKSDKIKVYHNSTSRGACYSRNRAIQEASGDFITGLDDDDYFEPFRVSRFVDRFSSIEKAGNSFIIALYDSLKCIRKNGTNKYKTRLKVKKKDLFKSNFIQNQIFIKRDILIDLGGFDESLPAWQDWDMWLRVINSFSDDYYMESIDSCSYVLDLSHEHERISLSSPDKISLAYQIFTKKYHKRYCGYFRLSYLRYYQVKPSFYDYLFLLRKLKIKLFVRRLLIG